MGVTSIRLNKKEEQALNFLKNHFHCDSSTLIKKSLWELYEDLKDREIIEEFERNEGLKNVEFISGDDLLKSLWLDANLDTTELRS